VVVGFTRHDVAMWQALMVRIFERFGISDRDIIQVAFNYSIFPGAHTFNSAAEQLGATLAPAATISAILQLQIMEDFRSTILATTASFALHIAETLEEQRINPKRLALSCILLGPDPLPETARDRIQEVMGVPVHGLYGVEEMVEPGLAGECRARQGLHLAEEQFLAEIVHPVTGAPLPPEHEGELVLTTLTAEGYPLIRYRTGDITLLHETPCICGCPSIRMAPVVRRTDNRVSVRGMPFYPEQVEELLRSADPNIQDFHILVYTRYGVGEQVDMLIVRPPEGNLPGGSRSQYLEILRSQLRRALGFGVRVQWVEPGRLPKGGLIHKTTFRSAAPLCNKKPAIASAFEPD
jgi:phenylacetate-CoA ligase